MISRDEFNTLQVGDEIVFTKMEIADKVNQPVLFTVINIQEGDRELDNLRMLKVRNHDADEYTLVWPLGANIMYVTKRMKFYGDILINYPIDRRFVFGNPHEPTVNVLKLSRSDLHSKDEQEPHCPFYFEHQGSCIVPANAPHPFIVMGNSVVTTQHLKRMIQPGVTLVNNFDKRLVILEISSHDGNHRQFTAREMGDSHVMQWEVAMNGSITPTAKSWGPEGLRPVYKVKTILTPNHTNCSRCHHEIINGACACSGHTGG